MPIFEKYNTATEKVEDELELTVATADRYNQECINENSPIRYIKQRATLNPDCTCGAETSDECVCEQESDYDQQFDSNQPGEDTDAAGNNFSDADPGL